MLVFRKEDQRAPHKPPHLPYCIGGVQARGELHAFGAVYQALKPALKIFAPRAESARPEYAFWRLQHDDLAEFVAEGPLCLKGKAVMSQP